MKILFLSARYPPDMLGGGEVSTRILAEALAAEGERVTVLSGAPEDRDETLNGVRVIRARALHPWFRKPLWEEPQSRAGARVVENLVQRHGLTPDVVHAQEFRSALSLSFLRHRNRVVTIRDYAPICGTTNNLWWDGSSCTGCTWPHVLFQCHRVAEAPLARKPFRVLQYKANLAFRHRAYAALPTHVYTSAGLRDRVAERLSLPPRTRREVIPNAVDPAWLTPAPAPWPHAPVLCVAGRLETTKGTDVLLDALARLRMIVPDVRAHLVGGGEVDRYQQRARSLALQDVVTFHGQQPPETVRHLIDAAAIVVAPHVWEEPFGRAALEAGARGRPLVASDQGGVRETTTSDTAVLVPPHSPAALAEALRALLTNPQRASALGRGARLHVERSFAPSQIAARMCALYSKSSER